MNALEEFERILMFGYNSEKLRDIKPKLDSYLLSCSEEEKAKCQKDIELAEKLIAECEEEDKLRQQYNLFHDYVIGNSKSEFIDLEYIEPYGNSYGVYIKVGKYVMEIVFKPIEELEKNEIRTKFYFDVDGIYKPFMIKRESVLAEFTIIQNKRRDYYPMSVRWDNWGDLVIKAIETVKNNPQRFLLMCESSCPYNNDGTHKFKSWKTMAKVEVSYDANTGIIQGVKKGEKPIKYDCFIDIDENIRHLKDTKEWGRLPYKKVNERLSEKVEVITYDMDKDPFERAFYPIEYDGSWISFLNERFRDI